MRDTAVLAFATLLVTVGPIEVAAMFIALTPRADQAARRRLALKGTLLAGLVLLGFAFGGADLLKLFGIGFPAFRIAGGILLLLLAIDMVFVLHTGVSSLTSGEEREAATQETDIAVFPLAIPLIAGPGAMTAVILLMGLQAGRPLGEATVVAVLLLVLALTYVALLLAGRLIRPLGVTGVNVLQRIFGILLAALAVQFILDGLRESHVFG